ncbi:MAG: ABC transporter permease subunit [Anaerolineaceae bacterium]|nr:ABC transporter permease subunit [Anaerolineaceae bacterium]
MPPGQRSATMYRKMSLPRQIVSQLICLFISLVVLFPILWIVGMSLDARDIARPRELFPPEISLQAFERVIRQPTNNPVSFAQLAFNSLMLAGTVALFSVAVGVSCAYILSRFDFRGRRLVMIAIITVLMLPSIATLAPLFVMLNRVQVMDFNLRNSLIGVGVAMLSGSLPFSIWNLKGYLDTIPTDLSEAARIDGASYNQTFVNIILPLATPALAVTFFLGFLTGWTEFVISWQFLTQPKSFTLAMALWNMVGQFSGDTPWSAFAAMALMVALPVGIVYLLLQKYIVSGLVVGSVK